MRGGFILKLFDSELKVMEILWRCGKRSATALSQDLARTVGWNKNTTRTVIKKCIAKGAIRREEPGFYCIPLIQKTQVQQEETRNLIDRMFDGSAGLFLSGFLQSNTLTPEECAQLERLIDELKGGK